MPTNVRTDSRDLVTQHSNAKVNQPQDPVFLKSSGNIGLDEHTNNSTKLNNPAGTVFDHGTQVAHRQTYMGRGLHSPRVIRGVHTLQHNGDNGFLSWAKSVFVEGRNAVMHAVDSSVNAVWSLLPEAVQNVANNGGKIVGGLSAADFAGAAAGEGQAMLDALMSTDTLIALGQTAALMGASAIPVVGQLAGGAAAAMRVKSVIQSTAGATDEFTAMMNRWTLPMSDAQIAAERQRLASFLTRVGLAAILAALGKALPLRSKETTGRENSTRPVENGTGPRGNATQCACATSQPVIIATGEKSLKESDFDLPGPIALSWERSYRSGDVRQGWHGRGWSTPLSVELKLSPGGLIYHDAAGREVRLPWIAEGSEHFDAYEQFTLSRPATHEWHVRFKDGRVQRFVRAREDLFSLPLAEMLDNNGNRVVLHYAQPPDDPFDAWRPHALTDSTGRELHLHWDTQGRLLGVGTHGHRSVLSRTPGAPLIWLARYSYTAQGELAEALDACGQPRRYEWRGGVLTAYTRRDGARFCAEYDTYAAHGRVVRSFAEADGAGLRFEYLDRQRVTRITDELGRHTVYEYDERRDIVAVTAPDGSRSETPFDANGHPRARIDALGRQTSYQFDTRGNLTAVVDTAGRRTRITYDTADRPIELEDALGHAWRREYDGRGNLSVSIDPLGRATRFLHDERGLAVQVIDARGGVKHLSWDAQGLLAAYTDCSGHTTAFEHDRLGRLIEQRNALGQVTRYVWDDAGRLLGVHEADGSLHRYEWDGEGRLLCYTDPLEHRTRYRYDHRGQPVERIDAAGRRLTYVYDTAGRLVELVNENGARTCFAHDAADRLCDEIGFDGRHQRYCYNAAGELTHLIETGGDDRGPGRVTHFERDALGRLMARRTADGEERYTYDAVGRMTSALNDAARVTFAYDPAGQLLHETQEADGLARTLAHRYDELGNRVATTLPDGRTLNWLFYGSGHLHQINIAGAQGDEPHRLVTDIERDALHREVYRSQGAASSRYEHDPAGRLTRHRTTLAQARTQRAAVLERRYAYDPGGQLVGRTDSLRGEQHFVYDPTGRILAAHGGPVPTELFAFDPAGNLLGAADHPALPSNRLSVYQDLRYEHDAHGNITTRRKGAHEVAVLTWDAQHRLTQAEVTRHGVTQTTRYAYDALGRRIAKSDAFGTTAYLWDGDLMVLSQRANRQALFLYEPASFVPLATVQDGDTHWDMGDRIARAAHRSVKPTDVQPAAASSKRARRPCSTPRPRRHPMRASLRSR